MTHSRYLLLLLTPLIIQCSTKSENPATLSCAGSFAGEWSGHSPPSTTLTLGADCTYHYIGTDSCESVGTYAAPLGTSGTVGVIITSATVGACLPAGSYTCSYDTAVSVSMGLAIDCGAGMTTFNKPL